jgi:hypothetical protein
LSYWIYPYFSLLEREKGRKFEATGPRGCATDNDRLPYFWTNRNIVEWSLFRKAPICI